MSRRFGRGLAGMLCLVLLIGCLGFQPVQAAQMNGAKNIKTTYSLSELKLAGNWGATVNKQGTAVSLSYEKSWGMIFYAIPEEVLAAGFTGCQFKFKGKAEEYALKLVGEAGTGFRGIGITYGKDKITTMDLESDATLEDVADIRNIAIVSTKNGANTLVVESVTFLLPKELEEKDIVNLKDAVTSVMGSDFIVGTAIENGDLGDDLAAQLVTKHFNAITFGNELKPQFIFNYYGSKYPQDRLETVTLNGKKLSVPKLDFSIPEKGLDYIYSWNQKNPKNKIRVRGHVLVWHAQTPEFFFHVDYDESKPYVDKATMSLREEWYIKSVAEHFMGTGSKYRDLFYAWDVVNEAASDDWADPKHVYRMNQNGESSSWWAVFQSNQFITDAFVFANKYMPKSVELYYNDYSDCWEPKVGHIVELLKAVKATPGARIDGMGMQAHYSAKADGISPDGEAFKKAVRTYCAIVDHVQITELDFTATEAYDGTSRTQAAEDERIAARYKEIYDAVKSLKAEGKKITGITIWGVTDEKSWLHAQTGRTQCPLLFDNNYRAKKSFYALVDGYQPPAASGNAASIKPKVSSVTLKKGESTSFELAADADTDLIKSIKYKSNKALVTVDQNGRITAKKKGNATVKAVITLKNGNKKTIKMKVKVK